MRKLCKTLRIERRRLSLESHRINGRINRTIRTIRDGILKSKKESFTDKVYEAIEKYNLSFHAGLKCILVEAVDDKTGTVMIENNSQGSYAKRFKQWYRQQFIKHEKVRAAKNENLKGCN